MKTSSPHQAPIPVIPIPQVRERDLLFRSDTLQPPTLEGAWIEIFRAGDYGERGAWSPEDLDRLAASYNPRLQAAPVVLGHPADDAPAYGWVRGLRRAGASLWAQLEKVDPELEALLRAGRFRQRSVALYTHFPPTGGPYLRHLGFLGAAPPGVKGLAPVRPARHSLGVGGFADAATVSFALDAQTSPILLSPEDPMSEPKSKLESFLDHLRAFFTPDITPASSGEESASADSSSAVTGAPDALAFAEHIAQLEQRLDSLAVEKTAAEEKLSQAEQARRREQVAGFLDSLRRTGRFPPAFERWGVAEFMERLAETEARMTDNNVRPTEEPDNKTAEPGGTPVPSEVEGGHRAGSAADPGLLTWFQDFLVRLPAVIEFRELGSQSEPARRSPQGVGGARLVSFTEPQRGMSVDPASVELAERAEALAAELGISYADALRQLREEARTTPTHA